MNSRERDELRRYLKRWEKAADLLQSDRAQRLRAMTDERARGEIAVLGDLWRSGGRDLGGCFESGRIDCRLQRLSWRSELRRFAQRSRTGSAPTQRWRFGRRSRPTVHGAPYTTASGPGSPTSF